MTLDAVRQELLGKVLAAAVDVCQWDWDDIDAEPAQDMLALKEAVDKFSTFEEVIAPFK